MTNTDKQRILDLRGQGFTYANIADTLGIPIGTVKSFCYRNVILNVNVCRQCGNPLTVKPQQKPKTFCCDRCRHTWWNNERREQSNEQSSEHI